MPCFECVWRVKSNNIQNSISGAQSDFMKILFQGIIRQTILQMYTLNT